MNDTSTIASLWAIVKGTSLEPAIKYQLAGTNEAKYTAIRSALDDAINQIQLNRHLKQGLSEDQLTIEICQMLVALGFDARHDEQIGGHCDIVVKGKNQFLWIAEAKKHSDYNWLSKGFLQLSTRYSTGVAGQDQGEIIIYCFTRDAKNVLEKWHQKLQNDHPCVAIFNPSTENPLEFWSQHHHESTGLPFKVRHKIVALHFDPAA